MTTIQTAEIESIGTATVLMGASGSPYIAVQYESLLGGSTLVPFEYTYQKLLCLIDKGYTLSDPHGLVTCHCGALKAAWQDECGACRREAQDAKDESQMYSDLREGL